MTINVTVSFDEELARSTRVAAAKAGKSMSKYLADAARAKIDADAAAERQVERNRQIEALDRILAMPKWDVTEDGAMPSAERRNARR